MILEKYKSNLSVRALNECKKSIENNRKTGETMKKEQARKLINSCRIAVDLMALGCFCGVAVMMLVNNGAPLFWALVALIVPAAVIGLIGVVFGSTFKN